jgi:prephenate dehydrogenase
MIAFLSQLPHVIAVSLMTTEESENLVDYTGDSFRDFTRIANINSSMWTELFLLNKEYLLEKIDAFMNEMKEFRDALSNEDVETMKKKMELSTLRRSYFIKK